MGEERNQRGESWEDLALPDPEPGVDDGAGVNEEAGENAAVTSSKCSTDLLQMLKAAERRRSNQSRQDKPEASEAETRDMITEALKTSMVSRDTVCQACIDYNIIVNILLL